jgi:hypothetical protein
MPPLYSIVAAVLLTGLRSSSLISSQLVSGFEVIKDLSMGEVICRSLPVPAGSDRVLVKASAVGLTGNPNLFGGWDQRDLVSLISSSLAPPNAGGYHVLGELHEVPPNKGEFHVCVTSFGTQGTDFILYARVTDASAWYASPLKLPDSYPIVWRLDSGGRDFSDFLLELVEGSSGLAVSVTPFSGEVDVQIWDCEAFTEALGSSAILGPDVLSVLLPEGLKKVCIRVRSSTDGGSEFALTASTDPLGPFLAQSIPIAGMRSQMSKFRAFFNRETDLSVLGQSIDKIVADTVYPPSAWSSDEHGKLELSRAALSGRTVSDLTEGDGILYIQVESERDSPFILSLTSHGTVDQLEEGIPFHVTVDSRSESRFRDFRVWIPKGAQILTIQGDSSEDGSGLGIFAGTVRTSHDPRGYMWNTMTGTNEIILSRSDSAVGDGLLFLPCDQCYVYISVKSCEVANGKCKETGVSSFWLTATTDKAPLHVRESLTFRIAVPLGGKTVVLLPMSETGSTDEVEDLTVFITPSVGPGVKACINTEPEFSVETATECSQPGEACRIRVSKDDAVRKNAKLYLVVYSETAVSTADIAVRTKPSVPLTLKNHHSVSAKLTTEDHYQWFVPRTEGIDAMVDLKSLDESTPVSFTVCLNGDCQSVSGSATVHLKQGGGLVSITVQASDGARYRIIPSFFSTGGPNALRLDYKPINLKIDPGSKSSWEVGYSETAEWLVSSESTSNGLEMCISDQSARCCSVPCALQGFGRQQVWIEDPSPKDSAIVTLSTESLSELQEGVPLDITGRKSNIFKIPHWPARVDGADIEYMLGSPDSDAFLSPPADRDVGLGQSVFVRIKSGNSLVSLISRQDLFLNEWHSDAKWVRYSEKIPRGIVRIERCDSETKSLTVDRTDVSGPYMDLETVAGATEIFVSGDSRFRVGIHSGTVTPFTVSKPFGGGESFIVFEAPKNAAGSLYRALCMAVKDSIPSQCVLERSSFAIHGPAIACDAQSECALTVPSNCGDDDFVTIVADRGTEFGLFEPISMAASLNETRISSSSSVWLWLLVKLLVVWMAMRWIVSNKILLRIWIFKAIDFIRFSLAGSRRPKSALMEEMVETGAYQRFREPVRTYGRTEMMSHRGGYYGA